MLKKLFSILIILTLAMPLCISPIIIQAAGINIGDYMQMGTYNGSSILWRCVDIDENGALRDDLSRM